MTPNISRTPPLNALSPGDAIKGFLFDLDGTLVPTTEAFYRAWITTSQAYGLSKRVRYSQFIRASQLPVQTMVAHLFGQMSDRQVASMQSDVSSQMHRALSSVRPCNGALHLLARLSIAGFKVAIVTNSPEERATQILQTLRSRNNDLYPFFTALVYPTPTSRPKPSPDLYSAGANALSLRPDQCIAVDDSDDGILAATTARIPAIQIATTTSHPRARKFDHGPITTCHSLYDLQGLLADWKLL